MSNSRGKSELEREIARVALGSAAAADKLDSCPHCGLKGKPFCWCGEHAPVREAAADSQENPA
jgi:hypothetical protein